MTEKISTNAITCGKCQEGRHGALATDVDYASVGESAEDWYEALGYHCGEYGHYAHPVCGIDEVDDYDPATVELTSRGRDERRDERAALHSLHEYALSARDAAQSIRASIDEAIEAHRRGDLDGVLSALTDAYRVESGYGDEPSTRDAIGALLSDDFGWEP